MSTSGKTIDTTNTITTSYQYTILISTFCFLPFFYSYRDYRDTQRWCRHIIPQEEEEKEFEN